MFKQNYLTCDFWYNSDCSEAERFYSVNERRESERDQSGCPAVYGGQERPQRPQEPLAVYVNQVTAERSVKVVLQSSLQHLPTYSPASGGRYGRTGKDLELQETVSLTSTAPPDLTSDYQDYQDVEPSQAVKRDLSVAGRKSRKYSWAAL